MRRILYISLLVSLLLGSVCRLEAQFAAQQSLIAFCPWQINPAFIGNHNALDAQLQYRKMWMGIDGAPTTGQLQVALPVVNNSIFGSLAISSDRIGLMRNNTIMVGSTYKLKVRKGHDLRFGLQVGVAQIAYAGNDVVLSDINDPEAQLQNTSSITLQMGTGIFYQAPQWYAGVSVPRMLTPEYDGGGQWKTSHSISAYNYHILLGKKWKLHPDWQLHTGIYSKKISALEHQTEGFALAETHALSAGLGYRHKDAWMFLMQWKVNDQLAIHYGYDYPANQLRSARQASHEWMLSYVFSYNNRATSPRTL